MKIALILLATFIANGPIDVYYEVDRVTEYTTVLENKPNSTYYRFEVWDETQRDYNVRFFKWNGKLTFQQNDDKSWSTSWFGRDPLWFFDGPRLIKVKTKIFRKVKEVLEPNFQRQLA